MHGNMVIWEFSALSARLLNIYYFSEDSFHTSHVSGFIIFMEGTCVISVLC